MSGSEARSLEATRAIVVDGLRRRQTEIQATIFARLRVAAPDPVADEGPEYVVGLSTAVAAALDYCLTIIEHGAGCPGALPAAITEQARRAVRSGVSLETVMRRIVAGERLLKTFAADEADHLPARTLDRVMSALEIAVERLMEGLAEAYNREHDRLLLSSVERSLETIRKLLAEEPVELAALAALDYDLNAPWHTGLIALGAGAELALRRLKTVHDCRLLAVPSGNGDIWAWLGGERKLPARAIEVNVAGVSLAVGDARGGIDGWRQTHREAEAALRLMSRRRVPLVRYGCRPLLMAALKDDTLARWLEEFLVPVRSRADGRGILEALRAYIDAECNYRAAGCALDHDRHTVASRVRKAEQLLGRPVRTCLPELDVALRLDELNAGSRGESRCAL